MAVGAIGNTIFVNQMTTSVSSMQNAHNSRVDFQNMVAQSAMQEKDEKVLEVRPTEENQEVDADREHEKNSADQDNARSKRDEEDDDEKTPPLHKLDIKV